MQYWKVDCDIEFCCSGCNNFDYYPYQFVEFELISNRRHGLEMASHLQAEEYFDCEYCENPIRLTIDVFEFPIGHLDGYEFFLSGARLVGKPGIEKSRIILNNNRIFIPGSIESELTIPIDHLILSIQQDSSNLYRITPRQFEEVVAEIFRHHGFRVELTSRSRDGGKDVIAISTDSLGIQTKIFLECKRYAMSSKVGVELVRSLNGVHNTKDGPNKSILVTTSQATRGAQNFIEESNSKWNLEIVDRDRLIQWIDDYPRLI